MAQRDVRLIIKKKETAGGLIPSTALMGEPFVNLYDGKMFFSGTTGGSYEPSSQSGIFEVGSKVYNQLITNRLNVNNKFIISGDTGIISTYSGVTGAGLSGKFLSGTSAGFVIADISDIATSTDSYTTGATWVPNTLTLKLNQGKPDVTVSIGTFNTLAVTGATSLAVVSATTIISGSTNLYSIFQTAGNSSTQVQPGTNITTGGTTALPVINLTASPSVNNITFSGTAIGGTVQAGAGTFTSISGGTLSGGTIFSGSTNLYSIFARPELVVNNVNAGSNITIGGTAISPTINLTASPSINALTTSGAVQINSTLTVTGNTSLKNLTATAITDSNLTVTQAVYAGVGGLLKSNSGFTYNDTTGQLFAQNILIGSPSLSGTVDIWGDVIVHGQSISAFTSQLYIEDNNIILNYNPTANTTSTSVGAGWTIQDGNGIALGDTAFEIHPLNALSGITAGQVPSVTEYTGPTGYGNRGWVTQLNDIVIRSTNLSTPSGVRVLGEFDVLNGGSF